MMSNVTRGFLFVASCLFFSLGLLALVVVLFFAYLLFRYSILHVMSQVVLSSARSLFMALLFAYCVSMPLIITHFMTFFNGISHSVDPSVPTVLCGDLNTVFNCFTDDTSQESTPVVIHLFDSCCVVDIWRYLHLTSSSFNWSRWNGSFASCIDLLGCANLWVSLVSSCGVLPCTFSDHCAVLFCVSVLFLFCYSTWSGSVEIKCVCSQ